MVDSALGVEVPDGDPAALAHAAATCRGIAGSLSRVGASVKHAGATVRWTGAAASAFGASARLHGSPISEGEAAFESAAGAFDGLADAFKALRSDIRRLSADAEAAQAAQRKMAAAAARAKADAESARAEADAARGSAELRAGGGLPDADLRAKQVAAENRGRAAQEALASSSGRAEQHGQELEALSATARRKIAAYRELAAAAAEQLQAAADLAPLAPPRVGTPGPGVVGGGGPLTDADGRAIAGGGRPKGKDGDEGDGGGIGGWIKHHGHTVLDGVGMVPVIGEGADAVNAGWYLAEGDWKNAAISGAGIVPGLGAAAVGARMAKRGEKALEGVGKVEKEAAEVGAKGTHWTRNGADEDVRAAESWGDEHAPLWTRRSGREAESPMDLQRRGPRDSRWRADQAQGKRVYKRDGLVDPTKVDATGRTNLQRMRAGEAPIGPDGQRLNLHHTIQTDNGPIAEVGHEFHNRYRRQLHLNWPPQEFPSGIDRKSFNKWRKQYWQERAQDFEDGSDVP